MKKEFRLEDGSKLRCLALWGAVFVTLILSMTAARAAIVVVAPETSLPSSIGSTVSITWIADIHDYPNKPSMERANTTAGVAAKRVLQHSRAWRMQGSKASIIERDHWVLLPDVRYGKGYSHGYVYLLGRRHGYAYGHHDVLSERAYKVRSHLSRAAAYRNGLFVR